MSFDSHRIPKEFNKLIESLMIIDIACKHLKQPDFDLDKEGWCRLWDSIGYLSGRVPELYCANTKMALAATLVRRSPKEAVRGRALIFQAIKVFERECDVEGLALARVELGHAFLFATSYKGHLAEDLDRGMLESAMTQFDAARVIGATLSSDAEKSIVFADILCLEKLLKLGDYDGTVVARDQLLRNVKEKYYLLLDLENNPSDRFRFSLSLGEFLFRYELWRDSVDAHAIAFDQLEAKLESALSRSVRGSTLPNSQSIGRYAYSLAKLGRLSEAVVVLERWRARALTGSLWRNSLTQGARDAQSVKRVEQGNQILDRLDREELVESGEQPERLAKRAVAWGLIRQGLDCGDEVSAETLTAESAVQVLDDAVQPEEPIVYLLATEHGALALIVYKDGADCQPAIRLEFLDSLCSTRACSSGGAKYCLEEMFSENSFYYGLYEKPETLLVELPRVLNALGESVMNPLAKALSPLRPTSVSVVAFGLLGFLPLHACPIEGAGRFLDRIAVSFLPNARFVQLTRERAEHVVKRRYLGVGSEALEWAPWEVSCVESLYRRRGEEESAKRCEGSRSDLVSRLSGITHLHLACHGFNVPSSPYKSHLALSGNPVRTRRGEYGGLEDPEIWSLLDVVFEHRASLSSVRLVILAACQTGLGDIRELPDEVLGIHGGFLEAGVPGVVAALSRVDDVASALLMVKFQDLLLVQDSFLEPKSAARALGAAQAWLRDSKGTDLAAYARSFEGGDKLAAEIPADREFPYAESAYWAMYMMWGH